MSRVAGLFAIGSFVCACLIGCAYGVQDSLETSLSPSSVGAPESLTSAVYADADAIDASKDSDACVPEVYVGTLPKEVDWNCPPIIIWPPREFTVKDLPYPPPF